MEDSEAMFPAEDNFHFPLLGGLQATLPGLAVDYRSLSLFHKATGALSFFGWLLPPPLLLQDVQEYCQHLVMVPPVSPLCQYGRAP